MRFFYDLILKTEIEAFVKSEAIINYGIFYIFIQTKIIQGEFGKKFYVLLIGEVNVYTPKS